MLKFTIDNFHGERAFAKYMEYLDAGPARQNEILTEIPHNLGHAYVQDGEYKESSVRELLISGSIGDTTLIQTEMYNTIMQGAEPRKVLRGWLPTINLTKGNSIKIPKGSAGAYAQDVAETAEIKIQDQVYKPIEVSVKKIGTRPIISKEMINDSLYDIISFEVKKAGARMENKLNRDILRVMLESGCLDHDCTGTNTGLKAIRKAQTKIRKKHYLPDKVLLCPGMSDVLLDAFLPDVNYSGNSADVVQTGTIGGRLFGLSVTETDVDPASSTKTWDYETDGYIGGLVADTMNFGAVVIREDIQVEEYNDPVRQLYGSVLSMRYETGILDINAGCTIQY